MQLKKIYRPEIDGLSELAVLSVILFHAGIQFFKGGFVGVDIFCNKDLKKCLIGNHENSFYIDDNHLSVEGVELIHNKLSKIFNSF